MEKRMLRNEVFKFKLNLALKNVKLFLEIV